MRLRKLLIGFVGLFVLLASQANAMQEMMSPVPTEIKQVAFLLGEFKAKLLSKMTGEAMPSDGTSSTKLALNGRYLVSNQTYTFMGQKMEGTLMLTFDPGDKKWKSWWFDGSSPGAMEMEGTFDGKKLIMTSKPTPMPGADSHVTMRATWVKEAESKFGFLLEMKQGDAWINLMEGTYEKK